MIPLWRYCGISLNAAYSLHSLNFSFLDLTAKKRRSDHVRQRAGGARERNGCCGSQQSL